MADQSASSSGRPAPGTPESIERGRLLGLLASEQAGRAAAHLRAAAAMRARARATRKLARDAER